MAREWVARRVWDGLWARGGARAWMVLCRSRRPFSAWRSFSSRALT